MLRVEESTIEKVPDILEKIAENLLIPNKSPESLQKDFLLVLIIVLLIENGFLPVYDGIPIEDPGSFIDDQIFSKWRLSTGTYEIQFVLSGFEDIPIRLIMSSLGSTVLVNVVIYKLNSETYSVCLPIGRYIVSPGASTIPRIFRDLKHFTTTFRNKILTAVKSRILTQAGYSSASLIGLPEEVLFKILLYLPVNSILSLAQTCKKLSFTMDNQTIWHEICKRDFKDFKHPEDNNWNKLYKDLYESQKGEDQRRSRREAGALHDYMELSDFVSHIDNPMWIL